MSQRFPPRRSRPRSPTAKALEIVRLTKRPKANSAGSPSAAKSPRYNTWLVNVMPRSGVPTSRLSMAPGARSEGKGAETDATRQIAESEEQTAPVTSPDGSGPVPSSPSPPPIRRRYW